MISRRRITIPRRRTISALSLVATLLASGHAAAQSNTSGVWVGSMTHHTDGYTPGWTMVLELSEEAGRISGTSRISFNGRFAEFELQGTREGGYGMLRLREDRLVADFKDGMPGDWCLRRTMALRQERAHRLKGTWASESLGCTGGEIRLARTRKVPAETHAMLRRLLAEGRRVDFYVAAYEATGIHQFMRNAMVATRSGARGGAAWKAHEDLRARLGGAYPYGGDAEALARAVAAAELEEGFLLGRDGTFTAPSDERLLAVAWQVWERNGVGEAFPADVMAGALWKGGTRASVLASLGNVFTRRGRSVGALLRAHPGSTRYATADGRYDVVATADNRVVGVFEK